ncbi:MAG: SIMPL domain-containing protein [Pseudomonadota bacterium]
MEFYVLKPMIIAVFGFTSTFAFAAAEIKGTADEVRALLVPTERTVTLKGQAEQKAFTDRAVISLVVSTTEGQLAKSLDRNAKLRAAITAALTAAGVAESDINTSKFATSPQFGWFGKTPDSYEVINRISVVVNTEAQLRAVGLLVDQYKKEVELAGTIYEHSLKADYEEQVKAKAMQDLQKQRAMYEENLGVKLVPVSFREFQVWPGQSQDSEQRIEVTGSRIKYGAEREEYTPPPSLPRTFDEVKYGAMIYVDYKIVPAAAK